MTDDSAKKPLIIITGPTAAGKSAAAIELAKLKDAEIVSADSMQVYRHMDIGTAKLSQEEMQGVPHHLIDILEPTEDFNVVRFQELAKEAIEGIYRRGHLPIVAGGTGFYIQALLRDIDFNEEASDPDLRLKLEGFADKEGIEALHSYLKAIDPESAAAIHPNNRKRVIRAVEYYELTGEKISDHNMAERERKPPYNFSYNVLTCDRDLLYQRIDKRVDQMMEKGLVREVQNLKNMGCNRDMVSMQGLGYKEMLDYLDGINDLDETVRIIKRDTRHFAKRQLTWFRREKDVRWLKWEDFGFDPDRLTAALSSEIP